MTENELKSMTVLQLRKLAKEHSVVLGAGIDKAGMIEKIARALGAAEEAAAPVAPVTPAEEKPAAAEPAPAPKAPATPAPAANPAPAINRAPAPAAPRPTDGPKFQAAWHNTEAPNPRFNSRPYQAPTPAGRPGWPGATPARTTPAEPTHAPTPAQRHGFGPGAASGATAAPRFGPAAIRTVPAREEERTARPAQDSAPAASPLPERRFSRGGDPAGYTPRSVAATNPPAAAPTARPYEPFSPIVPQETGINAPTLEELLASGDYEEGGGILELHPDGYGFLRADTFLPSSKDVYVSMAQIRRFGLRTGDRVCGKIRPQREGDKYAALLYISTVNGVPEESSFSRPVFDELTPVYPTRRISLESADGTSLPDMRLVDLIAPLGFGQRALMLCPPDTGKTELMCHFASVIRQNYPEAEVMMLLVDVTPEDATVIRDAVPCPVLASTFDQAPEAHLRLSEIVLERAMRLVEQKKDVVLLVDSLTRLAKIYTTASVQQGRNMPGMINPASLFRAKRLFGAARACKEGGTLTVIAAMDIMTGSRVDDSVVEEFKGTANMELTLDQNVARAGVRPAINLANSFTKHADILLDDRQKEGLGLIRTLLGSTSSAAAITQLRSMMDKADTNASLLLKMKDWFALMNR